MPRHSCGMKACGGDLFEQLIVSIVESLFPPLSTRLWADFTSESSTTPGLPDLVKFLKHRLQAVESVAVTRTATQPLALRGGSHFRLTHKSKSLHSRTQNQDSCPCCNSAHPLYQCSQFKSVTIERRQQFGQEKSYVCASTVCVRGML